MSLTTSAIVTLFDDKDASELHKEGKITFNEYFHYIQTFKL